MCPITCYLHCLGYDELREVVDYLDGVSLGCLTDSGAVGRPYNGLLRQWWSRWRRNCVLRAAFERIDMGDSGAISREQLPSAFSQVGMRVTEEQIAAVIAQLGKPDDRAITITFADFAQAADMLSPVEQ